ncbi:MAG: protease family protein [Solirubrobacteraceae bacterium]|jgi:membrane protease YdiL (CAAX protease family)|nr:protease family protein [Solirubrobacteraceae bacterium]MEA2290293.1 protease family protein [Solirubrobacteraceae bacterium]
MSTPPAPPDSFLSAPELPDGVEPRRHPRWPPWTSALALLTALFGALLGAAVIGAVATVFGADFDSPGVTIGGTLFQDACLIGSALLFARMSGPARPWQFGLRPTRFWPALGWMLLTWVAFYAFTAAWVGLLGLNPEEEKLPEQLGVDRSTAAMLGAAFLVSVAAPVAEEFFFRGFFFNALRNWRGVWPAAAITGIVFGSIHAGSSDPAFLAPLAVFGIGLCLLYVRTGSLYPCIALHCVNNSVAFGATQDWTWQIPVLLVAALAIIALGGRALGRVWAARPPAPAPAPAPAA